MSEDTAGPPESGQDRAGKSGYVVLARKYRPENFEDLIGQDAMVQTLRNGFASGRIAQAYMLTGVRGVGKTTTARILARALNYETDTVQAPSTELTEYGVHCRDILLSRHVDVQEIDAASHTGIDNIRELIESTRYRPVSARYKVYIIDEVHMLSVAAFNGLLKTLEEPPEHVKFIFATTEIRKVPVTVLSRCQRFDLRRIPPEKLIDHFASIAQQEEASLSRQALALIARAAEGSVRDGLSILDQVIARGGRNTEEISADQVRTMLGLADRSRILELLELLLSGQAGAAVEQLDTLYEEGAEPRRILADLAELSSHMTRYKVTNALEDPALGAQELEKLCELAGKMNLAALSSAWQILIKGLDEIRLVPDQLSAVMMILVRLAHAASLPDPGELVRALENVRSGVNEGAAPKAPDSEDSAPVSASAHTLPRSGPVPPVQTVEIQSLEALSAVCRQKREMMLGMSVEEHIRPVSFENGKVVLQLTEDAPHGFTNDLRRKLEEWTGNPWQLVIVREGGGETLGEQKSREQAEELEKVSSHPLVRAVLTHFEDAQIVSVRAGEEKGKHQRRKKASG